MPITLLNIFLLNVNFENSIIILYFLFISSVVAKFTKKSMINGYVTNQIFKSKIFVIYDFT